MIIDKCPNCNTSHVQTEQRFLENIDPRIQGFWSILRCQNPSCRKLVLVTLDANKNVQQIYPVGKFELEESVPVSKEIRDEFREAGLCLGSGCYKASMVMSRRVLQRCLKEQGCTQNRLVGAIDHAVQSGILRKAFHAIANEIRQYGNLGAHPDDDQLTNATRTNAKQILEFCRLLIHDFYEVPAAASDLKKQRENPQE